MCSEILTLDRPIYTAFSKFYDRRSNMLRKQCQVDELDKLLNVQNRSDCTIIDIACGTGTLACLLSQRGYRVLAIDSSAEMLKIAKYKAAQTRLQVNFIQDSMSSLMLEQNQFVAATCTSFSLSYLLREEDLYRLLRIIYGSLTDNGILLFDMIHPDYVCKHFSSGTGYIWEDAEIHRELSDYDSSSGLFCVKYSISERHNPQSIIIEKHIGKAYSQEAISKLLSDVGFNTWNITFRPEQELGVSDTGVFDVLAFRRRI